MSNEKPLVSVCMITYNHEAFIAQAIEGVLMQQTDFPIELVIGEDCSTDGTRSICEEYRSLHSHVIRLLPRPENLGMIANFVSTLKECRGKYVALCEGDDFWLDPLKLKKQVEFLEENPDFAICFHDVNIIGRTAESSLKREYEVKPPSEVTTFDDLVRQGNYIHTPACIFRNHLFESFPDWYSEAQIGDYPLHLLNAEHGKIKCFDERMASYRVHPGGVFSASGSERITDASVWINARCREYFGPRHLVVFDEALAVSLAHRSLNKFISGDISAGQDLYRAYAEMVREDSRLRPKKKLHIAISAGYFLSRMPIGMSIFSYFCRLYIRKKLGFFRSDFEHI